MSDQTHTPCQSLHNAAPRRRLGLVLLASLAAIAPSAMGNPDLTAHRTSPIPVPWEVGEPSVSIVSLAAKAVSDRPPADIEFSVDHGSFGSVNVSSLFYRSIDVERAPTYDTQGLRIVGPGPESLIVGFLEDNDLRPVDLEYQPSAEPPTMTVVAVPNTGSNHADWYIKTDASELFIEGMTQTFPTSYRPVDIEYAGTEIDGTGQPYRVFAIIAVINSSSAATGSSQWWARFDMTQSEILANQQALGRILDLEIISGRAPTNPRWDAIFVPWDEDRPVYNHVLSLASPTYADPNNRIMIPATITDDFAPEVNDFDFDLPGLTAGFRITDVEYYVSWIGVTPYLHTDGTYTDAATRLQFAARDAFAAATEGPLQSTDRCAFHMAEVGGVGDPIPGVHSQGRPAGIVEIQGVSIPAHMPFLTAYAALNDDLDLTEQQLNTCEPLACPPPTAICDPQLFTVRELLERMRDLQDLSSAQTLIQERYLPENIDTFIRETIDPGAPFSTQYLIDASVPAGGLRYCDARVSLEDLTKLITSMTDGSLGDAQSRADFLEYMFTQSPAPLDAQIDAVIDDEAVEYDLTPAQIQAFKDTMTRRWRRLAVDTAASINGQPSQPVTRLAGLAMMGVPFYEASSDTVTHRRFSINTYLESLTDDAAPLHSITAEALRDPIADALDAWTNRPAGCNDADLADPFGLLDLADIVAFVTAFTTADPAADFNNDTLFDLADIVAFVTAFNAGCP